MRRSALFILSCFLLSANACAEEEKLSITTYYPSPYGVYKNLRIFPGEEPDPASPDNVPGAIYFNEAQSLLYLYRNDTVKWQPVGGGGGQTAVLVRSCPWGSDGDEGADRGWGNQCGPYPNFAGCCRPPDCPAGWIEAGTEIKLTSLACPGNDGGGGGGGCEWHGSAERFLHPVAVGHVLRTCLKKGASVFTLSSPWRSDHQTAGANSGWGDQCVGPAYADCNGAPPACPAGYTSIGTDVEVHSVSCSSAPQTSDPAEGCFWNGTFMVDHPVASGSIVRICEEN